MEDIMRDELGAPKIVDRSTFHAELDALRVREKAHTREGDAIAAARRRLPMVEVDGTAPLIGERGVVTRRARSVPRLHGDSAAERLLNTIAKNLPSGKSKSHDLIKINANFDTDFKRRGVAERAEEAVAVRAAGVRTNRIQGERELHDLLELVSLQA